MAVTKGSEHDTQSTTVTTPSGSTTVHTDGNVSTSSGGHITGVTSINLCK